MTISHTCDSPRDVGYLNVCHVCGTPQDAGYFDVANIKAAPKVGEEVEVAQFQLNPQYCGTLLYFMQYAELSETQGQVLAKTPGYEWVILCNNQPRAPYLPTSVIRNPWGYNALPINLRLEEGCTLRFVVRKVTPAADEKEVTLSNVGGRLLGRTWYNTQYGGMPNRL